MLKLRYGPGKLNNKHCNGLVNQLFYLSILDLDYYCLCCHTLGDLPDPVGPLSSELSSATVAEANAAMSNLQQARDRIIIRGRGHT